MSARFDRYEILGRLGAGGMGEVVRARAKGPHGFEKVVAIKRISGDLTADGRRVELFIREAQIAARLQHPNIVQVFDFGRFDEELFIVMELVEGCSFDAILEPRMRRGEGVSIAQALTAVMDLARGLDYAHRLTAEGEDSVGVVHRDVSPANMLVSRDGVVKLTDFGIAAWAHPTRTSLVAGKPMYMAPEQLRGEPLDGRADLFAAGMILYEALTGKRPWPGIVDAAKDATLESLGYVPPSAHDERIPATLDALVEKLLRLDVEERLASAEVLQRALLEVSYESKIMLDPTALRALVGERYDAEHAPTLDAGSDEVAMQLAVTHSPSGLTMLEQARSRSAVTTAPPRRSRMWVAALVAAMGIGGAAAVLSSGEEVPPVAAARAPRGERVSVSDRDGARGRRTPVSSPSPEMAAAAVSEMAAAAVTAMAAAAVSEMAAAVSEMAASEMAASEMAATEMPSERAATEMASEMASERAATERASERAASEMAASEMASERAATERASEPPGAGAAEEMGTLNVFSRPWAELWIDGVAHPRNAPVRGLRVAAGEHTLKLRNPHLGVERTVRVRVPVGGTETLQVYLDEQP